LKHVTAWIDRASLFFTLIRETTAHFNIAQQSNRFMEGACSKNGHGSFQGYLC